MFLNTRCCGMLPHWCCIVQRPLRMYSAGPQICIRFQGKLVLLSQLACLPMQALDLALSHHALGWGHATGETRIRAIQLLGLLFKPVRMLGESPDGRAQALAEHAGAAALKAGLLPDIAWSMAGTGRPAQIDRLAKNGVEAMEATSVMSSLTLLLTCRKVCVLERRGMWQGVLRQAAQVAQQPAQVAHTPVQRAT